MPVDLQRCRSCATLCHPPRVLCPVCGGAVWAVEACASGMVEECTTVTGATPPVVLASVRCLDGPVLMAALPAPVPPGTQVTLHPGPLRSVLGAPIAAVEQERLVLPI